MLDDAPIFPSPAEVAARLAALPATPFLAYFKGRGGFSVVVAAEVVIDEEDGQAWILADLIGFDREPFATEWTPHHHRNYPVSLSEVDSNIRAAFRDIVADYNAGKIPA